MLEQFLKQYAEIKGFTPCEHCANILTKECLTDCIQEGAFRNFELLPGTGIEDVQDFPMEEILTNPSPRYRLVSMSIYLAVITDFLKHRDEYEFRKSAKNLPKRIPDRVFREGYKFWRRRRNGHNPNT